MLTNEIVNSLINCLTDYWLSLFRVNLVQVDLFAFDFVNLWSHIFSQLHRVRQSIAFQLESEGQGLFLLFPDFLLALSLIKGLWPAVFLLALVGRQQNAGFKERPPLPRLLFRI